MKPATSEIEDIKLPLKFILTGMTLFVCVQVLMLFGINDLVRDFAQVPSLLAAAHLLILGFGTMVVMGAMYQLVPVALQTKIHSIQLGHWQYLIYTIGVLGLWWGFFDFSAARLLVFAIVTVIGVLLFEWNLWRSLNNAVASEIRTAVQSALIYLLFTVAFGLWLVVDFYTPHLHEWHDRLLAVHISFGTVGWFTMLIVGFSYKLVPMFTLSHRYESKFGPYSIYILNIGLTVTAIGFLINVFWITVFGMAVILTGFVCYGMQLRKILAHRMRKNFDPGVAAAICAVPFTLFMLAVIAGVYSLTDIFSLTAVVYLILLGWISLSILGYLYKIIPFLWWTYRYSGMVDKKQAPNLNKMIHAGRGRWWLVLLFVFIAANIFAIMFGSQWFGWIGQSALLLVSMFYILELMLVLRK